MLTEGDELDSSYYEIGQPKKGETIFVTAAAGAVGQLVCQLALHDGLNVIASAGDDKKVEFLKNDIKVAKSFNYKKKDTAEALKELAPDGIDIFYDVGCTNTRSLYTNSSMTGLLHLLSL